jgi:DNA-binding NtrC family response regulator
MTSARSLLAQQKFGVVLCGEFLPDGDFRAVLEEIAHSGLDVPVIVLSRLDDWGAYLNAIRAGAFDYIACPPDCAEAGRILCLALEKSSGRYRVAHPAA